MGIIRKNEQKKAETDSMENKEYPFPEEAESKVCRYCQVMVPKTAKICPNCKKRLKKNRVGILLLLCLAAACAVGGYYYLTVYSVTERVSSAAVDAETVSLEENGQSVEACEVPEGGTAPENTVEAEGAETDMVVQIEDLPVLPAVLEGTEASGAEFEKGPENGAESGLEKELEASTESGLEKELEAGTESGLEKEPEAGTESGLEKEPEAGTESGLEKELEADTGDEFEKEPEAGTGDEFEKEPEAGTEKEFEKESEFEKYDEESDAILGPGMDSADNMVEIADISDYTEEEFRNMCGRIDYRKLLRSQELYLNAAVVEELTVIEQVDGGLFDENIYYLCKREDEQGIMRYYIIRDDREADAAPILEGDVLRIYGQLFGSCKLPGYLVRTQPVVPALTMVYFDFLEE